MPQAANKPAAGRVSTHRRAGAVALRSLRSGLSTITPGALGSTTSPSILAARPRRSTAPRLRLIVREQFEVVAVESAIAVVTICLDPAPASERVTARSNGGVADPDRSQDLLPARRAREISIGLGAQAANRVGASGDFVLRGEIITRVLELECAPKLRAVVVFGDPAQREKRARIGERPAPAIEADHALEVGDRLALDRLTVESRLAQPPDSLATASPVPLACHQSRIRGTAPRSQLVGIV